VSRNGSRGCGRSLAEEPGDQEIEPEVVPSDDGALLVVDPVPEQRAMGEGCRARDSIEAESIAIRSKANERVASKRTGARSSAG
jgi:hypothetical protein